MTIWNVWVGGKKLNAYPLNETQAKTMAFLQKLNYNNNAKAIKEYDKETVSGKMER